MSRKVDYQSLLPPNSDITVTSLEDLLSHREAIFDWFQYWQEQKSAAKAKAKDFERTAKFLAGTDIAELKALAGNYELPLFSTFDRVDGAPDYLYPSDPDSKRRRACSTTLNVCAWCAYAQETPGTPESICILRPICTLMPDEVMQRVTSGHGLNFHGPCFLLRITDEEKAACVAWLEAQQKDALNERRRCASKAQRLANLMAD